ncbi:MAG: S-layer family protein [Cyanobacteria bacterium J06631_12]
MKISLPTGSRSVFTITLHTFCTLIVFSAIQQQVGAQVIPDSSVNTQYAGGKVTGGFLTSDGGQQNLFHSFAAFSLSPSDTVTFVATPSVKNIITRVTGSLPSSIDGTLQVGNSAANFFLINPEGISFGPNAQLNLLGSFTASTAESFVFNGGSIFSAANLEAPSLLTVSAPIGLQMGEVPSAIAVHNTGYNFTRTNPLDARSSDLSPTLQEGDTIGLQVAPGKTLALIGAGIEFDGGVVTANSGHLEIGSVGPNSFVGLIPTPIGFAAHYRGVSQFEDIHLANQSAANVSGFPVEMHPSLPLQIFATEQGSLQVVGQDIHLSEASLLLGQNGPAASLPGGDMRIRAATLSLQGSQIDKQIRGGILSGTLGATDSGNIFVAAENLDITEGAAIIGVTYTDAASGSIEIEVENQLRVHGSAPGNAFLSSVIGETVIGGAGQSGDIVVNAPNILLEEGGGFNAINFSEGDSGDLYVVADTITLRGRIEESDIPSAISASNLGSGGAGKLDIQTRRLSVSDGATVAASSISSGDAGSIRIVAREQIDLAVGSGERRDSINSSVLRPSLVEQHLLGVPDVDPTGNAGNIFIQTPMLNIEGQTGIAVQNGGSGKGGQLEIQADQLSVREGGQLRALTVSGEGGDIDLQLTDSLILRGGSLLNVESRGAGNGGNISIVSPLLIALENSDIVANAVQGQGGNIDIVSQSVLGTAFRDRLTPESDITASSEFGINGTVAIDTPQVDPSSGAIALSTTVVDPDQQIAAGCAGNTNNQFIASGRGGLSPDPRETLTSATLWQDVRPTGSSEAVADLEQDTTTKFGEHLQEAHDWARGPHGEIQLLAGRQLEALPSSCLGK